MTFPGTLPTSPAVGDEIAAGQADLVAQALTYLQKVGLGITGGGFIAGPGSTTSYTTNATVVSLSVSLTSGRYYRVTACVIGSQITSTGVPTVFLTVSGTGVLRPLAAVSYTASSTVSGTSVFTYIAAATSSITFAITAQTSAGALQFATDSVELTVEDIGIP